MAFKRFEYSKLWTNSDREKGFPTYEASEDQVRKDMQLQPNEIRDFINNEFMGELETTGGVNKLSGAEHIGDKFEGNVGATLAAYAAHFDQTDEAIRNLAGGESPEAVRASKVTFTSIGWVEDTLDVWELRILQSQHKRLNDAFGYKLQSLVGETYMTNTWEVARTDVRYDSETQDIVLTAENPYNGVIVFYGV